MRVSFKRLLLGVTRLLFCSAAVLFLGSLFGAFFLGTSPAAAIWLAFYAMFRLWPFVLFFGVWIAAFPPVRREMWLLLSLATCIAGVCVSWLFQTDRPFDFYHETDGSMPGWEPVHMVSWATALICLSIFLAVTLSTLFIRRLTHNATGVA
jgi:hypothetical protein